MALSAADILPSDTKKYRHDDVVDAIEDAFGASARLHCDGEGKLSEVSVPMMQRAGDDLAPMRVKGW